MKRSAVPIAPPTPMHSSTSPWETLNPKESLDLLPEFMEDSVSRPVAVHDAWVLIRDYKFTVPDWLVEPTISLLAKRIAVKKKSNGRSPYATAMRNFYRWRAIMRHLRSGHSQEKSFGLASEELQGSQYEGDVGAMKKAFKKVTNDLVHPKLAFRYYTALKATRKLTGTEIC